MNYKEAISLLAIALTFFAFAPYIGSIWRGETKPHIFSWVIWGSTTFVVFLAQLTDGGGAGAWPIGVSGVITIYVAILAYRKKSDKEITKVDWLFFAVAMSSIPLWYVTANPLWAVIILTTVDGLGFGPTFRKAYLLPKEESLLFFGLMAIRNVMAIVALERYSLTTILFPAVTVAGCLALVVLVKIRRRI